MPSEPTLPPSAQAARQKIILAMIVFIGLPLGYLVWQHTAKAEALKCHMVAIPGGEFAMGNNKIDATHPEENPQHLVQVKPFWMDETEVTNEQFAQFVAATGYVTDAEKNLDPRDFPKAPPEYLKGGSLLFQTADVPNPLQCTTNNTGNLPWWKFTAGATWQHPEGPDSTIKGREKYPVICVTYKDAQAFAKWAGKRLPTEAEWEFAARGGLINKPYVWGDEERPGGKIMCNHWQGKFPVKDTGEDGFKSVAPVKSFPPNGYGLYDMAGNVWEMCEDWYGTDWYAKSPKDNPLGPVIGHDPEGTGFGQHVIRGGSWLCDEAYCFRYRATARQGIDTLTSTNHVGFRCVQDQAPSENR